MNDNPVNINCDLGEGLHNEDVIMPLINSCNIACGGHAGDPETMRRVIALARDLKVAIGAHPSYPDRENFGRKSMKLSPDSLTTALNYQMKGFEEALLSENAQMDHIKAHGALYNDLTRDPALANTYLDALEPYKDDAILYVPFDAVIAEQATARGFRTAVEAFGDRNYTDTLELVSRNHPKALITEKEQVLDHIRSILSGTVITLNGCRKSVVADTICIHSDTENAVEILQYLKDHLSA